MGNKYKFFLVALTVVMIISSIFGVSNYKEYSYYKRLVSSIDITNELQEKRINEAKIGVQNAMGSVNLYDYYNYKNSSNKYDQKKQELKEYRLERNNYENKTKICFALSAGCLIILTFTIVIKKKKLPARKID